METQIRDTGQLSSIEIARGNILIKQFTGKKSKVSYYNYQNIMIAVEKGLYKRI